jgi:hypothetical protein
MKILFDNEVSSQDNSGILGRQEHRVNITPLVNDFIAPQIKLKILNALEDQKGRLEVKDGTIILCFWNPKDKVDFLVNLQ